MNTFVPKKNTRPVLSFGYLLPSKSHFRLKRIVLSPRFEGYPHMVGDIQRFFLIKDNKNSIRTLMNICIVREISSDSC